MLDEMIFGDSKEAHEIRITIAVPGRAVTTQEIELREMQMLAGESTPMLWLEVDDADESCTPWNFEEWERWFNAPLTLAEAFALADIYDTAETETFRRQLIVARECNGTMDDYFLRCEAEGIAPLLERKGTCHDYHGCRRTRQDAH